MSKWQDLELEEKVTTIFRSIAAAAPEHHLGYPFLTAYQIAIALEEQYPDTFEKLDMPLGGSGTGQHQSAARYLGHELSQRIKRGELPHLEGGLLSHHRLLRVTYKRGTDTVESSQAGTSDDPSIYRLRA